MICRTRTGSVRTWRLVRSTSSTNRTPARAARSRQTAAASAAEHRQVDVDRLHGHVDGAQPGELEQVGHEAVEVVGLGPHDRRHARGMSSAGTTPSASASA